MAQRVLKFTALGFLLLTPYLGFLLLFPKLSIQLVCKNDPEYTKYAYIVVIVSLSTGMIYLNQAMGEFLGGVERSRLSMISQIVYSASFALIGMPLTAVYKFPGAAWGGFIACVLAAAVNLVNVKRVIHETTDPASETRGFEVMPVSTTIDAAAATSTSAPARRMNVLLVHNFYQQAGGEDQVFADETKLLRDRGHAVEQFTVHNDAVDSMGRIALAQDDLEPRVVSANCDVAGIAPRSSIFTTRSR